MGNCLAKHQADNGAEETVQCAFICCLGGGIGGDSEADSIDVSTRVNADGPNSAIESNLIGSQSERESTEEDESNDSDSFYEVMNKVCEFFGASNVSFQPWHEAKVPTLYNPYILL